MITTHIISEGAMGWQMPTIFAQPSEPVRGVYLPHKIDNIDRFYELLARWRNETAYISTMREKINNRAFQEIVALGKQDGSEIIPLILSEISRTPDFLVMALHLITGENEIPQSAQGDIEKIVDAWLSWASRNNINVD